MKNSIIKMVGKELVSELEKQLNEFELLDLDANEIMNRIKKYNSFTIMCLYLLALEQNYKDLSFRIKRASECIEIKLQEDFIKLAKSNNEDKLLSKLDRVDIINLAHYMNLYYLDKNEYNKLDKENKKYFNILSKYI